MPLPNAHSGTACGLRPPAVPLITADPYFSVWSMSDTLADDFTRHWTGAHHTICGMARIDGRTYRFISPCLRELPVMEQVSLQVFPTRSIYILEAAGIRLTVTFTSPLLMDDLKLMSRPASYMEVEASSTDDAEHDVVIYLDFTGEFAVNTTEQRVTWGRYRLGRPEQLQVLRIGSADQPVLQKYGDNLRIDWGHLYLALPDSPDIRTVANLSSITRAMFAESGAIPDSDDLSASARAKDGWPALVCTLNIGRLNGVPISRFVTLVYDDIYSVEYLRRRLHPYWRAEGWAAEDLIRAAVREYPEIIARCKAFDSELLNDAKECGGSDYADIVTLAYRQAIAAHKLVVDVDGTPLFFSKENSSNGCMGTVDVSYPSSPMFLLFNAQLLRAMLEPILQYSESPMWPHDFAPHDIGTYPLANGQTYGTTDVKSLEYQMPVEESGNMLIMLGALAHIEGSAEYAGQHWEVISQWAAYLKSRGMDPENQICTDDFMGHLAHNTNLSIKAIIALACYAKMAEMLDKADLATDYRRTAEEMAAKWKQMASEGDHYKLAFDQPGTWSMKYNLVWDKILGLGLFDPSISQTEVASYLKRQNNYGLPLDNRSEITKGDWIVWSAALADREEDFRALIAPLRRFLHESPSRVPFSDRHWTTNEGEAVGFRARSVVGGVYIKMLDCPDIWRKWSAKPKVTSE